MRVMALLQTLHWLPLIAVVLIVIVVRGQRRNARLAGYPSLSAYLRAAPRTDEERRNAVDLALKGLVICLLGLLVPPLLLIGLFPLFYGHARSSTRRWASERSTTPISRARDPDRARSSVNGEARLASGRRGFA